MKISGVELKLLQSLVALIEEASVTRAAERMEISQPRMSNALRRLREICDDPLLVRAGQHLVPTKRAIEIADSIRRALDEINIVLQGAQSFDPRTSRRTFVVMMSDYTAGLLLPEVMRRITGVAPGIEISLLPMTPSQLQPSLEDGTCDLAFGYFQALHSDLRISSCFSDYAVCIAGPGFSHKGSTLSLQEFVAARHVCTGDTTSTSTIDVMCDRKLRAGGHRRQIAVRCPTPMSVARIVSKTDLLGLLPMSLAMDYQTSLNLQCMTIPLELSPFDVSMVWHERSQKDLAHAWLREQFRQATAEMGMPVAGHRPVEQA